MSATDSLVHGGIRVDRRSILRDAEGTLYLVLSVDAHRVKIRECRRFGEGILPRSGTVSQWVDWPSEGGQYRVTEHRQAATAQRIPADYEG